MERERQARWDAAHLRTASTKMTAAEYENLRRACESERMTVYGLIRRLLAQWLNDFARRNPVAAENVVI